MNCASYLLMLQVEFSNFGDKLVSSGGDFKVVIWSLEDFSILGIYDEAMAPVKRLGPRQAAINEIFLQLLR